MWPPFFFGAIPTYGVLPYAMIVMVMSAHLFVAGVFIARGKEDALVTKDLVPGESVYGEKRISVEVSRKKRMTEKTSVGVVPLEDPSRTMGRVQ